MADTVLVTGVEGQDGWYLSDLLLRQGARLVGTCHHLGAVQPGHPLIGSHGELHELDVTEPRRVEEVIATVQPDRVFHLAGFTSVGRSWASPGDCLSVNTIGLVNVVQALDRVAGGTGGPRLVFASTSEIFEMTAPLPFSETTPLGPVNPYGISKSAAHLLVKAYRARGLNCSNAILFNHESPLRTSAFVTGRIAQGVARIHCGLAETLTLGNLDARRDWCYAGDVARALDAISRAPGPDDWVVASGVSRSVADFAAAAFRAVGITDWERFVRVDAALLRTGDSPEQRGDATKMRTELGWEPHTPFEDWVAEMVSAAVADVQSEAVPSDAVPSTG